MVDEHWQVQGRQEHGWFGHGTGGQGITKVADKGEGAEAGASFPTSGLASVYADSLNTYRVKTGARYSTHGYSAALLGDHRGTLPLGSHVMLEHDGRRVVVEVNDLGPGSPRQDRVFDLSHAAAAALVGKTVESTTTLGLGIIKLDKITVVPKYIRVGPGP